MQIIIVIDCFLCMHHTSNPFHPIATSPNLAESDARLSLWDAPYSFAADTGKSDLCGRVEKGRSFVKELQHARSFVTDSGRVTSSSE